MTALPQGSAHQNAPIVVKLLSQRGSSGFPNLLAHLPGNSLDQGDIRFTVDPEAPADVVVIQNYLKYDTIVSARKGYIWKWDNEPIVRQPFAKGLDRIYTHVARDSDKRIRTAPPILDWWVEKSYDDLIALRPPKKTKLVSAIASTKQLISGHRERSSFVELVKQEFPDIDIFGQGRSLELSDKWDGLAPYRYSVAIENTSKPDYWTEKIADCFLSFTVPLYFGATNIEEYFPRGSFIWLPINDPQRALEVIRETVESDNWQERLADLEEARKRVLERYSLGAQLTRLVNAEASEIKRTPFATTKVEGRRTRPGGWIRNAGWITNLLTQFKRLRRLLP